MFRYLYPLTKRGRRILQSYPEYQGLAYQRIKTCSIPCGAPLALTFQFHSPNLTKRYASSMSRDIDWHISFWERRSVLSQSLQTGQPKRSRTLRAKLARSPPEGNKPHPARNRRRGLPPACGLRTKGTGQQDREETTSGQVGPKPGQKKFRQDKERPALGTAPP